MLTHRPSCLAILLVTAVVFVPAIARAQSRLVERVENAAVIQAGLSIGALVSLPIAVTPCQQDRPTAAAMRRRSKGVWAARFDIESFGSGAWTLAVQSADGSQKVERNVGDGATVTERIWLVGPLYGDHIDIVLRGPAQVDARCPIVRLLGELQERSIGKPRGLVGPDNRWQESSMELNAVSDASTIRGWSPAVVYLETLTSPTSLIPCTGFFISPRLVLTAAHCLEENGDISKTRVRTADREIRGSELTLVVKKNIDFAIVQVRSPPVATVLGIGSRSSSQMVMWQTPRIDRRVVSVDGCAFLDPDGSQLRHKCDTSDGSSGSPLQVRASGAVVGIQVAGCLELNLRPECINFALGIETIRTVLLDLEPDIRAAHGALADELFAALRPPQ